MGNLSSRIGDMVCPTTPKGKDDWLFPRFEAAEKGEDPQGFALRWPAWENIVGFLEQPISLFARYSRRAFMQEVLGMFVSWFGAIWLEDCGFDPQVHIRKQFKHIPYWWNRIEVIDMGWSDYAVWIAAVVDDLGNLYIVDEAKFKFTTYTQMAAAIQDRRRMVYPDSLKRPPFIPVYVDPEEPRARTELNLASKELDSTLPIMCLPANNDVMGGFEAGAARIANGMFFVTDNCEYVIESLENHEWSDKVKADGTKIQRRDAGIHGSDVARYLQLTPIRSSIKPVEQEQYRETMGGLLVQSSGSMLGMTTEQWRRLHGIAA
jgi:hypothetical protein